MKVALKLLFCMILTSYSVAESLSTKRIYIPVRRYCNIFLIIFWNFSSRVLFCMASLKSYCIAFRFWFILMPVFVWHFSFTIEFLYGIFLNATIWNAIQNVFSIQILIVWPHHMPYKIEKSTKNAIQKCNKSILLCYLYNIGWS